VIISASRRTDIPALYAEWFLNRIRAGYCTVPNPFNSKQISHVPLGPQDVDVIVFWTRNPQPMLPRLEELDRRDYRYYFQFTVMDNPRELDAKTPPLSASIRMFKTLAEMIGPDKVVWRYDPIVFSRVTDVPFHVEKYRQIAASLRGSTRRSVISIMDVYAKASGRLRKLAGRGIVCEDPTRYLADLIPALAQIAASADMEIVSCAEPFDLRPYGVSPGKCVDNDLIERVFHFTPTATKDPAQRELCGCVVSKDIGMYDTCLFGCQYCYATSSFERARVNYASHNPLSPSLIETRK